MVAAAELESIIFTCVCKIIVHICVCMTNKWPLRPISHQNVVYPSNDPHQKKIRSNRNPLYTYTTRCGHTKNIRITTTARNIWNILIERGHRCHIDARCLRVSSIEFSIWLSRRRFKFDIHNHSGERIVDIVHMYSWTVK